MDEYLKDDAKNIMCSLLRIVAFIRQHKLKNKTTENVSQISEFAFVV